MDSSWFLANLENFHTSITSKGWEDCFAIAIIFWNSGRFWAWRPETLSQKINSSQVMRSFFFAYSSNNLFWASGDNSAWSSVETRTYKAAILFCILSPRLKLCKNGYKNNDNTNVLIVQPLRRWYNIFAKWVASSEATCRFLLAQEPVFVDGNFLTNRYKKSIIQIVKRKKGFILLLTVD